MISEFYFIDELIENWVIKNRNSQLNCSYFSAKYVVVFLYE